MRYQLVESIQLELFNQLVNDLLDKNWSLCGSPVVCLIMIDGNLLTNYAQAMTKAIAKPEGL